MPQTPSPAPRSAVPRVACIGVGNVGRSWALAFARGGCAVRLWDREPAAAQQALGRIDAALQDLHAQGLLAQAPATVLARITVADTLAAALADATHVQESAAEMPEVKRALFSALDEATPPAAVIASSTSALPGSTFMGHVAGKARCLVAHPVNPPHLIPLVEICPSPWTAPAAVTAAAQTMRAIGQAPVLLSREVTGFLLNRLQWALLGEALHLVGEGYCSADDIDRVLTQGLALRWAFAGPFEVGHLNASAGLQGYFDTLGATMDRVRSNLQTNYPADPSLVARLHADLAARLPVADIPARQAWRDRRIAQLTQHLAAADGGGAWTNDPTPTDPTPHDRS